MDWAKFVSFNELVEKVASNRLTFRGHILVLFGVFSGIGAWFIQSNNFGLGLFVIASLCLIAGGGFYVAQIAQIF